MKLGSISRTSLLTVLVLAAPAQGAQCPTVKRVQNYTNGPMMMSGWCEELAGEGEAALFSTIPVEDLPVQIVRIGIGWRATTPGITTTEAAIQILGVDPLGMFVDPPALYSLSNPVFVDGQINVFDVSSASTPWIIGAQPFTLWVKSNGTSCEAGSMAHDADGCTPNKNRFRAVSFPFLHQWHESCVTVGGDAVVWVEYVSLNDCPTGTQSCFGDGSGAPCPCGNTGAVGRGCDNSVATGGGRLEAHGAASAASDSLQLRARFLPPTSSALFFQGTSQVAGGAGAPFGDGLRCVSGSTIRLGTNFATGGAVDFGYGVVGDPWISVAGAIPPTGGTREYQVWYRNAPAFCTSATYNLTNGTSVVWTP